MHFSALDLLRKVLVSHDMLFLSRQISYHVAASSELPEAWADQEGVRSLLSQLIEYVVKRAPRRSPISMAIGPHSLRSGPAVEVSIKATDSRLEGMNASAVMAALFSPVADEHTGFALARLREDMLSLGGRMWVDLPRPDTPVYHLLLPTLEGGSSAHHQTFRYDIRIVNYANVRKRFGIRKSLSLVAQIEHYVRSLVRYPIDMVMSSGEKGLVTTIYETQEGSAESVASRISQRLARETFHIGRKPVDVVFGYKLTVSGHASPDAAHARKRRP